jgi:hypothetical protein
MILMMALLMVSNLAVGGLAYLAFREASSARRDLTDTRMLLLAELRRLQPSVYSAPKPAPVSNVVSMFDATVAVMLERSLIDRYGEAA